MNLQKHGQSCRDKLYLAYLDDEDDEDMDCEDIEDEKGGSAMEEESDEDSD